MILEILISALIIIFTAALVVGILIYKRNNEIKSYLIGKDGGKREEGDRNNMFEFDILNKIGDRMDYSLSVQNVIEVITGSLSDYIDYSVASFILLLPEKMILKVRLDKPVSRMFLDDVKSKMIDSLSILLNSDLTNKKIEEILSGKEVAEELGEGLGSYFNIPLVISDKVAGLLTVADTRKGFYTKDQMTTLYKISQQVAQAATRLQAAIDTENSKLNAMVASMTDGVIMTDVDFKILVANPAAKRAIGLEDKNDLSMQDFIAGLGEKLNLRDRIEESVRLEKIFLSEEITLSSGVFKIIVSPVKDNWKLLGCVVVFRDITHEKELERIKEDFTSMIVHELRSPLDSIKKIIELMRKEDTKNKKRSEVYQMVYGSSSDMLELVNNLLDMAKIEAGKFQILKQKTDIKTIIEKRILFFDIAAKDAKLKLESSLGKNIPDDVEFDPHTIPQVLSNFISNALKFTKEGGIITVQALLHKNGESLQKEAKDANISWFLKNDMRELQDSLVVAVTDNGIGIAPDQIGKLFNKFVQAKTDFVQKGGTGLGLAITKSIIDSHGGTIGVESVEGKGTTFYFTLPILKSEETKS